MASVNDLLREALRETGTTQSALAAVSGVAQPTISQILSGKVGASDAQGARLLACLGRELEVERRSRAADLTRPEWRTWRLHRRIASLLDPARFRDFRARMSANLDRAAHRHQGEPHVANLREWRDVVDRGDLPATYRLLTGLDRHSIEMREVSPFAGFLTDAQRLEALAEVS